MTAAILERPPATGTQTRERFAGTAALVRLNIRRERVPLAAWILAFLAVAGSTFSAIAALYPDARERVALQLSISGNPSFLAITGPITDTSIGGIGSWRIAAVGTSLVGLMAIFTVIRRTRGDEETGRTELLASAVVGRAAPLASAVLVAVAASLTIGVLVAAAGIASGESSTGSILFGAALAGCGLTFAGVGAITAQIAETSRTAVGMACSVLAATFILRAIGDVQPALHWLTWMSPQGWAGHVEPFGANRAAVLGLFVIATAATLIVAGEMLERRDLGLGMVSTRLGVAENPRMSSAGALAIRLQRGSLVGWAVGFVVLGAVTGGVSSTSDDLVAGNPQLEELLAKIGGGGAMTDTLLATMGAIAGLIAAGYAISAALRMSTEETADRVGPALATAVSRPIWMRGHLAFAVLGPVILLASAGVVAGILNGIQSSDFSSGMSSAFDAMIVQVPAVLVLGGLAVALFGWFPRLTSVAWAALVVALLLGQLGPLLQLPQWLMDMSPFTHVPTVPTQDVRWTPLIVLTVLAAALIVAGVVGFRRRDVS